MNRRCDTCTMCCSGLVTLDEVGMGRNIPCPHVISGVGCSLFGQPSRPKTCGGWFCFWVIKDSPMPEYMRPDKTGVLPYVDKEWTTLILATKDPEFDKRVLAFSKLYASQAGLQLQLRKDIGRGKNMKRTAETVEFKNVSKK